MLSKHQQSQPLMIAGAGLVLMAAKDAMQALECFTEGRQPVPPHQANHVLECLSMRESAHCIRRHAHPVVIHMHNLPTVEANLCHALLASSERSLLVCLRAGGLFAASCALPLHSASKSTSTRTIH